jgi:hypothetical protein
MAICIAARVIAAWDQAMEEESPDPFLNGSWFGEPKTYRERLDAQPMNYRGRLIPRIVTVRNNLRRLGKPKNRPSLPD